ncbi:hypothetical protein BDV96DRAFT_602436 [Lophiotrema nucula]|uniref:Uncharacterized protein n=1 Tax=Lophiotrema nucula TaxID=690887 RepID=A0A6A5YZE8_9PLEO|nr:hypothetical protein BDV96DRAFT_602436 [Lophiotrema nucula]
MAVLVSEAISRQWFERIHPMEGRKYRPYKLTRAASNELRKRPQVEAPLDIAYGHCTVSTRVVVSCTPRRSVNRRMSTSKHGSAGDLLQMKHDQHHLFFRDLAGHNYLVYSIMTVMAYDDRDNYQRPLPPLLNNSVKMMRDPEVSLSKTVKLPKCTNFLAFFEEDVDCRDWQAATHEYCLSCTVVAETMLAQISTDAAQGHELEIAPQSFR